MQSTDQKLREAIKRLLKAHRITVQAPPKTITDAENQIAEIQNAVKFAEEALALPTAAPVGEREAFEKWWKGDLVDWRGHDAVPALHAWDAWQARAALPTDDVKSILQGALNVLGCLEYGITGVDSWPCEDSVENVVHRIRKVLEESQ